LSVVALFPKASRKAYGNSAASKGGGKVGDGLFDFNGVHG
jgi:hypothetical protein